MTAIGAAIFTFFALFPKPRLRPRVLAAALLPMLLVAGWQASFGWRLVWAPPRPVRGAVTNPWRRVTIE
jgi:hypothetical protein